MVASESTRNLRRRLEQGIAPVVLRCVDDSWGFAAVHLEPLRENLAALYETRYRGLTIDQTTTRITAIAETLATHRTTLLAVLLAPHRALDEVSETGEQQHPDHFDAWLGLCWLAEAAWQAVTTKSLAGPEFATGDADLLRPLAARLRFLALSEPMRHRGKSISSWLPTEIHGFGAHGLYDRLFGVSSWNTLTARCREARRTWLEFLNIYQSHPYLATATAAELESDLNALLFTDRHAWPLTIAKEPLTEARPATAEDEALVTDLVTRHLLPRFSLLPVARTAMWTVAREPRLGRVGQLGLGRLAVAAVVAATAMGAVTAAALLHPRMATLLAAACYALIGIGTVVFQARWAMVWLLRIPACGTVGAFVLLGGMPESWAEGNATGWGYATTALTVATLGYLLVEASNHGVGRVRSIGRSLVVTAIGAIHAVLVALIALVAVGPTIEPRLGYLWRNPDGYAHGGAVLAVSAAWCLAVGVFSQILWDNGPITAPLAHTQWRPGA